MRNKTRFKGDRTRILRELDGETGLRKDRTRRSSKTELREGRSHRRQEAAGPEGKVHLDIIKPDK